MTEAISRSVQVGEWIFEIKTIRALKVKSYGQPYTAIANLCLNGDSVVLDGEFTADESGFIDKDYQAFFNIFRSLGIKEIKLDNEKHPLIPAESSTVEVDYDDGLLSGYA